MKKGGMDDRHDLTKKGVHSVTNDTRFFVCS